MRARHVLEDEARRVLVAQRHLGHHADVVLPGQALDLFDLAELPRLLDPVSEIMVGDMRSDVGPRDR